MARTPTEPLSLESAKRALRREAQRSERGLLPVYGSRKLIRHYPKSSLLVTLAMGVLLARSRRSRQASMWGLRFALRGFQLF